MLQLHCFLSVLGLVEAAMRIGIIGGGVGGTSCAFFLRRALRDAELDLFEAGKVGGRLQGVRMGEREYEAGGSIIHPDNFYMTQLTKLLGLKKRGSPGFGGRMGFYDGRRFRLVLDDSDWKVLSLLRLLWHFGFDILKLDWHTKDMLAKFSNIYSLQEATKNFKDTQELLRAMDKSFVEQLSMSLASYLKREGISARIVEELGSAATRSNYGQNPEMPAFVGNVALAGAQPGFWAVHGGNWRVPELLLRHSAASLHNCSVETVSVQQSGKMDLICRDYNQNQIRFAGYDQLILAAPLIKNRTALRFEGLQVPPQAYGEFHRTVATFVRGEPNWDSWPTDFGRLDDILCTDASLFYYGLGLLTPVDLTEGEAMPTGDQRVWKVFSSAPLSEEQLRFLFKTVHEKQDRSFLAYPNYLTKEPPTFHGFRLGPNVHYINSIEWLASAMEMSIIGARNVANSIIEKVSPDFKDSFRSIDKTEL